MSIKIDVTNVELKIEDLFKTYGVDCTIHFDTDFWYEEETNDIAYSFIVPNEYDLSFKKYYEELGLRGECSIFTLSLLHEVGHRYTLDDLEDRDFAEDEIDRIHDVARNDEELYDMYYRSERESVATKWAVNFINRNYNNIRTFDEEIIEVIRESYVEV